MRFATSDALTVTQIAEAVTIGQSTAAEHLAVRVAPVCSTRPELAKRSTTVPTVFHQQILAVDLALDGTAFGVRSNLLPQ